jgi:DNA repair protein RecO (recombination protein O)
MPTITDSAICIRRWDFSETSQTVSVLTRGHGVIRGLAKGAKRQRGSFSGGLDLLTQGQLVAIVKPGRDLSTLTHWHLERTFPVLRQSLPANRAGWHMADLVHLMLTEHDPHRAVFDALVTALETLGGQCPVERVLLRFQWALLRETGYQPRLDHDAGGARTLAFSPTDGGIVADTGDPDRWRVRSQTVQLLREVAAGRCPKDAAPTTVQRACRLLATYLCHVIGREPVTLRWIFPDVAAVRGPAPGRCRGEPRGEDSPFPGV